MSAPSPGCWMFSRYCIFLSVQGTSVGEDHDRLVPPTITGCPRVQLRAGKCAKSVDGRACPRHQSSCHGPHGSSRRSSTGPGGRECRRNAMPEHHGGIRKRVLEAMACGLPVVSERVDGGGSVVGPDARLCLGGPHAAAYRSRCCRAPEEWLYVYYPARKYFRRPARRDRRPARLKCRPSRQRAMLKAADGRVTRPSSVDHQGRPIVR